MSARFGYTEATEHGREVVVEDSSGSHLGDLSQVVDIHRNVLVLACPVRRVWSGMGCRKVALAAMAEKGYAAFFDVVSEPRQYVRSDQYAGGGYGRQDGPGDDARSGGVCTRRRSIAATRYAVVDIVCGFDVGDVFIRDGRIIRLWAKWWRTMGTVASWVVVRRWCTRAVVYAIPSGPHA